MIAKDFNPNITYPNYLTRNRLLEAVQLHASKLSGKLLDFGCGAKPYKSLFSVEEYIGLDFENPAHPHINEQIDVFYDGKNIPFENNRFDSLFASEVLEHIFNPDEIISEWNRVLKPKGLLLITCPFAICEHEVPYDYARYSSFGLTSLLERNGFKVLSFQKTGNSVEVVFQLWLMYIHQHISPILKRIPIVRSLFRLFTYSLHNILALCLSKVLPNKKDLYLNNIVLAEKIS